jgi:membrane protein
MKRKLKWLWNLGRDSVESFFEDKTLRLSAALAYYSLFSIAPLLIIVIALAGLFMGEDAVRRQIEQQLGEIVGPQTTKAIVAMTSQHRQGTDLLATAIGLVVLLFGASGVFGQIQDSLNVIWGVQPKPGLGLWGLIKARFLSFAMVLGIGFLLLVSMVITTVLSALTGALGGYFPMPGEIAHLVNFTVSFLVITLLFAMIFKVLPDARVKWRDVWVGALFTAFLFTVGKYLLALYLGRASVTSSFGAAGSLVVMLLWVYYSSVILFFGAEFTKVYAKATGSRIVPAPHAVPITHEARAEQGMPKKEQFEHLEAVHARGHRDEPHGRTTSELFPPSSRSKSPPQVFRELVAEQDWKSIREGSAVVRERPWPYITLALSVGVVTGWLMKRDFAEHRGIFQQDGF